MGNFRARYVTSPHLDIATDKHMSLKDNLYSMSYTSSLSPASEPSVHTRFFSGGKGQHKENDDDDDDDDEDMSTSTDNDPSRTRIIGEPGVHTRFLDDPDGTSSLLSLSDDSSGTADSGMSYPSTLSASYLSLLQQGIHRHRTRSALPRSEKS